MKLDRLYTFDLVQHTVSGDGIIPVVVHDNSGIRRGIYVP